MTRIEVANQLVDVIVDTGSSTSQFPYSQFKEHQKHFMGIEVTDISDKATLSKLGFLENVSLFGHGKTQLRATFSRQYAFSSPILGLDYLMRFNQFCLRDDGLFFNPEHCGDIQSWHSIEVITPLQLVTDIMVEETPFRVLLDTGASFSMINYDKLTDRMKSNLPQTVNEATIIGTHSHLTVKAQIADTEFTIDGRAYRTKFQVVYNEGAFSRHHYDASLGLTFFDAFETVMFDFENMKIGLGRQRSTPPVIND
ncbi:hypothetical protein [Psychrobium sp. 1_MG-2023]|uniref:hypothetical protein n=1 Tax=Psychrobium sp. 1_MG-2023 TaxID=3062624 RepID=UPI000C32B865|nr:hypothetical protein [Psychrobium sp. 1_MG-2023]MDP2561394.1 hypothetical protein [Psychrobium sp. 1_MG-2023]PKF54872.1 hypothetical protein CW748_15100 [Alteromonadales bacterium alter-6D02]